MAHAIREQFGATFGIGVTGVPGPAVVEDKPVGLAYFAIASASSVHAQEMRVSPRRLTLKRRVANAALIDRAPVAALTARARVALIAATA